MEDKKDRRMLFMVIFIIGLVLTLFNESIFYSWSLSYNSTLMFSSIIAIFGGIGFLFELYKKD